VPQHVQPAHVGQVQVQKDDVVVVDLAQIDALFAEVGRVDVEALDFSISSIDWAVALSSSISRTRIGPSRSAWRRREPVAGGLGGR
jgi:hypothetical protein